MTSDDPYAGWARATLALSVLAVDPVGLGGLWIRARAGALRDRLTAHLDLLPLPCRRLHPNIADDQLFGGLDLSATLASGHAVMGRGVLGSPAALVLTMAERCPGGLAARLGGALDQRGHCLVALDEGAEPDEALPPALSERLGLFVTLDGIPLAAADACPAPDADAIAAARDALPGVACSPDRIEELTVLAARLGIPSLRAPLLALAAARAVAALFGRNRVTSDDIQAAAELVYAHRATSFPDTQPQDASPPEQEPPAEHPDTAPEDEDTPSPDTLEIPAEMLIDAVRAALPPEVLALLADGRATRARSGASGTGAARKGNRRGRPLPSRPGRLDGAARIDLVATLRTAAPWQPMRRAASPRGHLIHVRPADIRLRRYEEKSDRVLVFAVDASGSSAVARLAEVKGAVELLLGEAYARRDHVALIAFRGTAAELILPPTRSLVQTKRRLAALPGGGGTPLAAGLHVAMQVAAQARARGMTPTLALLTDGRGNIALDGTADRALAAEDAARMARALRAQGTPAVVIDTSARPQDALRQLAAALDAPYLPLPRADAQRLSSAVSAALAD